MKILFWTIFTSLFFSFVSCKKNDDTVQTECDITPSLSYIKKNNVQKQTNENLEIKTIELYDYGEGLCDGFVFESNVEYILKGRVFINSGNTATIQPGTVIKGAVGQGENASALIVARGAYVEAKGTAEKPIIFTSIEDETVRYTNGTFKNGTNLSINDRGLWGGLIILGKAQLTNQQEVQTVGVLTSESRAIYGGTEDEDNSGIYQYISVRHGGINIGSGNEINGITLGGVGAGTTIDHVEVFACEDDGIEFLGGTARVKHAIVAFCGDDSFDYDEGYRGYGQFWFALQNDSDRGGEYDGGPSDCETCTPYAIPTIYNATYFGDGTTGGSKIITFRDNAGGHYANSIFANFEGGIDIENVDTTSGDSFNQFEEGNLTIKNNIFYRIGSFSSSAGLFDVGGVDSTAGQTLLDNAFTTEGNVLTETSPLNDAFIDFSSDSIIDPTSIGTEATTTGEDEPNNWFSDVSYKGAFSSNDTWHLTWSTLDMRGYFTTNK